MLRGLIRGSTKYGMHAQLRTFLVIPAQINDLLSQGIDIVSILFCYWSQDNLSIYQGKYLIVTSMDTSVEPYFAEPINRT